MAKVNIEIDTETRSIVASVNGKTVENLKYISAYQPDLAEEAKYGYKQTMVCIEAGTMEEGVCTRHSICAGEKDFTVQKDDAKATASALSEQIKKNVIQKLR